MKSLFANYALQGAAISLAVLAVVLLAPRLQKRYGSRWLCRLWLVITLLFLVPFRLFIPTAPGVRLPTPAVLAAPIISAPAEEKAGFGKDEAALPAATGEVPPEEPHETAGSTAGKAASPLFQGSPRPTFSPLALASFLWLLGAAAMLLWQLAATLWWNCRALRRAQAPSPSWQQAFSTAFAASGLARQPRFVCSGAVGGPLVAGLFRPVVFVPEGDAPGAAGQLMLAHELTHLKRRDLAFKGLLLLARALHWYNPAAWLLMRRAGRDIESACDEQAVAGRGGAYRAAYCEALLAAARMGRLPALSSSFALTKQDMLARFARLRDLSPKRRGLAVFAALGLCAALAGGMVACGEAPAPAPAATPAPTPFPTASPMPDRSGSQEAWSEVYSVQFEPHYINNYSSYDGFVLQIYPYYKTDYTLPAIPTEVLTFADLLGGDDSFRWHCQRGSHGYTVPSLGLWDIAIPSPKDSNQLIVCSSRNGAKTWTLQTIDLSAYVNAFSRREGWNPEEGEAYPTLYQYQFVNPEIGFLVFGCQYDFISLSGDSSTATAQGITVLRTLDGGKSWQQMAANSPLPLSASVYGSNQIYFCNENLGYAASHSYDPASDLINHLVLFETQDGGANWQPIDLTKLEQAIPYGGGTSGYHVCYIMGRDPDTNDPGSLLVGAYASRHQENPILLFTNDYGASWAWKPRHGFPASRGGEAGGRLA